jgi:hypothetical protein
MEHLLSRPSAVYDEYLGVTPKVGWVVICCLLCSFEGVEDTKQLPPIFMCQLFCINVAAFDFDCTQAITRALLLIASEWGCLLDQ